MISQEFRIRLRRGTAAQWADKNPVLFSGEVGYVADLQEYKIGDGVSPWNDLPFVHETFARFVVSAVPPTDPPPAVGTIHIPAP